MFTQTLDDSERQQSKINHRRHASVNSAFKVVEVSHGLVPLEPQITSTMDISSTRIISNSVFQRIHHQHQHRSPRNLHSRSFSDYTHPYPTSTPPHSSGSKLVSINSHRRATSTNTFDLILQPLAQKPLDYHAATVPPSLCQSISTATTSAPGSPTANEESGYTSDETVASSKSTNESKPSTKMPTASTVNNNSSTNRYICSYCSKGFSRPSSLRIHTYSHTGERPFECPEEGCSRKFSVQSNMRRHLRVHQLGKPLKRNANKTGQAVDRSQLINKPLAAKPPAVVKTGWINQH